jgi:aminopeptidase N
MLRFIPVFLLTTWSLTAQVVPIYDSGGALMPEQAAYNVSAYDLALSIEPAQKSIQGILKMVAEVVHPMHWLVLDLDTLLQVDKVVFEEKTCAFERKSGKLWIDLERTCQPKSLLEVAITYGGKPKVAPRAPWDGGFTWAKTPSGKHWIATTCQSQGADLWFPCKDHVSDEPDTTRLHIRVPSDLIVASNGILERTEQHADNTTTFHWKISNPINIYNIALNIAPYRTVEDTVYCVTGETYPIIFYVLPEDYEKGVKILPEFKEHLAFFEKYFGPYPFRNEKYGVAQTPHLGMEHQTIIAYGANFRNGSMTGGRDWGFDALHHHELSHEWWGNLVTCADWKDAWIHEGFGTYTQALYMEEKFGKAKYIEYMQANRRFTNVLPLADRNSKTSLEAWRAPIYPKGAWILHTLRYVMGEKAFFSAMRRMAYPTVELEKVTDGSQTHFSSTDEFLHLCEKISGQDLDWYFEIYLRQPKLPTLDIKRTSDALTLQWSSPITKFDFVMPVEVEVNGTIQVVKVTTQASTIQVKSNDTIKVDPSSWILMERNGNETVVQK